MAMQILNHNRKISKALSLLNKAADEKRDEIQQTFNHAKQVASDAIEEQTENIKQVVETAQKTVKKNPWAVIGGTAAGALVLGFLIGTFRKK